MKGNAPTPMRPSYTPGSFSFPPSFFSVVFFAITFSMCRLSERARTYMKSKR